MSQENNKNPQEEIDLIQLFEYFKNGIKSIFRGIYKIFEYFLYLLFLLKKGWYILGICILLSIGYGIYKNYFSTSSNFHIYEMIVRTNYLSNQELYSFISQFQLSDGNIPLDEIKLSDEEKKTIVHIGIEPIKNSTNELNLYCRLTGNYRLSTNIPDSLIVKKYSLNNITDWAKDTDFSEQKITLKTKGLINSGKFQEQLLNYFNTKPNLVHQRDNYLAILEEEEKGISQNLLQIDNLLSSYSEGLKRGNSISDNIVLINPLKSEGKSNETNLIEQSKSLIITLKSIQQEKEVMKNILYPLSDIKEVSFISETKKVNLLRHMVYGLFGGIIIIFLLQFNRYLGLKFDKK